MKVKELIETAETTTEEALEQAAAAQLNNPNGLVFPKDYAAIKTVEEGVKTYNTVDGLLFYAENEIVGREKDNPSYGITLEIPKDKQILTGRVPFIYWGSLTEYI